MMGAALALQTALVAKLKQIGALSGVYHDVPARAAFPYAVLACDDEQDWSCKGREGREIVLRVDLWDDQPGRLLTIENAVELETEQLAVSGDWHLSSVLLTGKRQNRNSGEPWSCSIDYRVRVLSTNGEGDQA